jgi:hypothetical protein
LDITNILVAFISVLGSVVAAFIASTRSAAVTTARVDELTREVREHNNFARRMPVVEEQIKVINHRLSDLEKK